MSTMKNYDDEEQFVAILILVDFTLQCIRLFSNANAQYAVAILILVDFTLQ